MGYIHIWKYTRSCIHTSIHEYKLKYLMHLCFRKDEKYLISLL